ncbi:MAG: tRNA (adenosine(37)-N6)-threonylcarbamoyltransferase complex dimerization subunit type 1 TsaB [Nitrospira sp.]|nr:tRNA (adenosine(37)-N6)-threonylcarbamoyltransferase complex dimerization subunit type 1 TsaB [Nitrospira sp.]
MKGKRILAVETATLWQSVAILEEDVVLAKEEQDAGGAHGLTLLPAIDRLFERTALRVTDLDGLACSIGPGSFTGIRVGVATCLGLRTATGLPLMLVPTLEAMAMDVESAASLLCPMLMGRTGELYWAIFRMMKDGRLERILPEHVGPPEAVAASLGDETTVFGEGWFKMEQQIRAALSPSITLLPAPGDRAKPSAVTVGVLGLQKLREGEVAGDCVMPLYVQRSEAELVYERSGGISPVVRRQERVAAKVARRLAQARRQGRPAIRPGKANGA